MPAEDSFYVPLHNREAASSNLSILRVLEKRRPCSMVLGPRLHVNGTRST